MAVLTEPIRVPVSDEINLRENISPFDVPNTMIASYCGNTDGLEIGFRYISTEELKVITTATGLKFSLGKNSNRIYSLYLSDARNHASQLEYSLLNAFNHLERTLRTVAPKNQHLSANLGVIQSLILENSPALSQYLQEAIQACQM